MKRDQIRFDGWVLDRQSGELMRDGRQQRLQELPLKVLDMLLADPGAVVSREQLIAHLWPKGVVDFDTGLNTAVRKLRLALGDTAETPRYIETLARRGYRFIGRIDPEPAPETPEPPSAEPEPPSITGSAEIAAARSRVRSPFIWVTWAGICGVLIAAGIGFWAVQRAGYFWRNPLANAEFRPVTEDFGGSSFAATLSRDGTWLAFLGDRDGRVDAWSTRIGSGDFQNLTRGQLPELVNPSIRTLGFSPDGARVLIWARQRDGSQSKDISIWSAPRNGAGAPEPYLAEAAEYDWSSDGRRLVYHTTAPGDPLFVREAEAPTPREIHAGGAGVHCHFPIWSPDNAYIYFTLGVPPDGWDVWRIRPAGGKPERITFHHSMVSHPVLLDARTLLYLATDHDGSGPWLYVTDVERRKAVTANAGIRRYTSLAASADGSRLVATVAASDASLWTAPIRSEGVNETAMSPVPLPTRQGSSPRVAPGFTVYVGRKGEREGLWKIEDESTIELWGAEGASIDGAPVISPDAKRIAFKAERNRRTRLYVAGTDGLGAREIGGVLELRGGLAWTPDGHYLVSAALQEGVPHLFKLPVNGDAPSLLISEYSIDPVWSPDGSFLVYAGPDVGTTFPLRAAAADGRPHALPGLILTRGSRVRFLPGSRTLVILRGEIERKNFSLFDLDTGVERPLTNFSRNVIIREFDISADGSRLVFDRIEDRSEVVRIDLRSPLNHGQ